MNLKTKKAVKMKNLSAVPLMRSAWGGANTQTLGVLVQKRIFTQLSALRNGVDFEKMCLLLQMEPRPTQALLSYCMAAGWLEKHHGRYRNSALTNEFLVEGKPDYFGGTILMWYLRLYPAWLNLKNALQENKPQTWKVKSGHFESIHSDEEELRIFCGGMDGLGRQTARVLAQKLRFSKLSPLLDVGGCSGGFLIRLCLLIPSITGAIFDLKSPLKIAEEKIKEAGMADRIQIFSGDFFKELPRGFRAHFFSMICHDWPPEDNLKILKNSFDALPYGGTAIISELMMDDDMAGPLEAAQMGMNMLIENTGFNYTWKNYENWLKKAGFTRLRRIRLRGSPGANGVITAIKPKP